LLILYSFPTRRSSDLYEIFDSFLKNILASVYINSDRKESFKLKEQFDNFEKVREGLWMLKREGSLLKVIRRISPFYAEHEKNNIDRKSTRLNSSHVKN